MRCVCVFKQQKYIVTFCSVVARGKRVSPEREDSLMHQKALKKEKKRVMTYGMEAGRY